MGFFKSIGKALGVVQLSDEEQFEKDMKRKQKDYQELNYSPEKIFERQLDYAYEHRTQASAFWWYEHLPEKPNLATVQGVRTMIEKYDKSFAIADNEKQKKFLDLVLPDSMDYIGVSDSIDNKADFINKLLEYSRKALQKGSSLFSPFLSPMFWTLFHRDEAYDENGELQKEVYMKWVEQIRGKVTFYRGSPEEIAMQKQQNQEQIYEQENQRKMQENMQDKVMLRAQISQLETQLNLLQSQIMTKPLGSQERLNLQNQEMPLRTEIARLKEKLNRL